MFPYVSADLPYRHQAPKVRPQFQRDQRSRPRKSGTRRSLQIPCADCRAVPHVQTGRRSAETSVRLTQIRARPAYSNSNVQRRREHEYGVASRRGDGDDRGAGMSWSGLWPGSPGNRGRPDPAKTRRCGAGSRRTDGRSRRPPARPGVTRAPRRWGTVSLPF